MKKLTQKRLKELLHYDPKTGAFTRRAARGEDKAGELVGNINANAVSEPYWRIYLEGTRYLGHRLAWLYVYGKFPSDRLDHIDGDGRNNSISNLREASVAENMHNSRSHRGGTSKFKGVSFCQEKQLWAVHIQNKHVGRFKSETDAAAAYDKAAKNLFGEFARLNFP